MNQVVGQHPDLWEVTKSLKSKAIANGHKNPTVSPNGKGYALTCTGCGSQTHVQQDGPQGDWFGMASPAHRLNTSGCYS